MSALSPKKVLVSQLLEDLTNGLTRYKKDDIGFGSLEKKYNLSNSEMAEVLVHPKLRNVETKIPAFIIEDDTQDEDPKTSIEVGPSQETKQQEVTAVVVKKEPVNKGKIEAFI